MTSSPMTTTDRSIITDKELNYLKDFLSWELLAMKKCFRAAQGCTDTEIKQALQKIGQSHQQHYEQLLAQLH